MLYYNLSSQRDKLPSSDICLFSAPSKATALDKLAHGDGVLVVVLVVQVQHR